MSNQRKLIFYGAMSVDGYLARENHSLDWLIGTVGEEDVGYSDFYKTGGKIELVTIFDLFLQNDLLLKRLIKSL
jgi:hypothetical protein